MPFKSKYEGKCKDCGKQHTIGDMIEKNNNEHWCKDGKYCMGAMQMSNTPSDSIKNRKSPDIIKDSFILPEEKLEVKQLTINISEEKLEEIYIKVDNLIAEMLPIYNRIIKNLVDAGIKEPNPALVGMLFNNVRREFNGK